jgi:spermidine/putrescine transport system substrate-binding protein
MHPKERRFSATRRDFLKQTGGAAFALSSAGGLLAACGNSTTPSGAPSGGGTTGPVGPGGLPLARPNNPVTLPQWEDPIASGLEPETGGTFTVYNYPAYLYKKLLKDFGRKYKVDVQYTSFDNIATGIQKLALGTVQPDVMEMTPDHLDQAVAGKLIKPLNLDYIPNLKANVWPELVSPFYDVGSRYTVPYTMYATGILWRTDQVTEDIASMPQPWDIFWQSQAYKGKVWLLTEDRETIAMALLRKGITDINTEDPKLIDQAVADLKELNDICNIKLDDNQFQTVPEGNAWLHQAWAGDLLAGFIYYLPAKWAPTVMAYWKAPIGHVPVQNDCFSICHTTKKPVLSHLFLNFLLDNGVATDNFVQFNGYQPPINELDPAHIIKQLVDYRNSYWGTKLTIDDCQNLNASILTHEDFGPNAIEELTLTSQGNALWINGYSDFSGG